MNKKIKNPLKAKGLSISRSDLMDIIDDLGDRDYININNTHISCGINQLYNIGDSFTNLVIEISLPRIRHKYRSINDNTTQLYSICVLLKLIHNTINSEEFCSGLLIASLTTKQDPLLLDIFTELCNESKNGTISGPVLNPNTGNNIVLFVFEEDAVDELLVKYEEQLFNKINDI